MLDLLPYLLLFTIFDFFSFRHEHLAFYLEQIFALLHLNQAEEAAKVSKWLSVKCLQQVNVATICSIYSIADLYFIA